MELFFKMSDIRSRNSNLLNKLWNMTLIFGLGSLVCGMIFAAPVTCLGQEGKGAESVSPERFFSRGNDYYEKGEYENAITEYEKILAGGKESAPLYYNIANSYFKSGKLGKAILNYERAKCLMPRDADLNTNYKFAKTMVKGKVISAKSVWSWRPIRMYCGSLSVNELVWVTSGAYVFMIILLFITLLRPGRNKYFLAGVVLLVVFIVFNSVVIWRKARYKDTHAVTIVSRADAFFGPFDTATKFFTLPEGMSVTVFKSKNGWYKVRRADGKVGWVNKSDIKRL
ncbi:MAG: tetratricopeptide repeat protein [Candidatus Omnitrophota bacterium]|nr:tetratricopeptide repeat protein [Candidatus Omnitrophota bacterium]